MSETIVTDAEKAGMLSAAIQAPLAGYTSLSMEPIAANIVVSGSSSHDGLSSGIKRALSVWSQLISADAADIETVHAELDSLDSSLADAIMGQVGQ
ncbi:MAG: hypothetical protein LBH87_03620 [Coriobacteriales bacterium]|jgi:hypothetical protein|nr:hypothetical protein [Coriobacteriales bacterium]